MPPKSLNLASKPTLARQLQFQETKQTVALVARQEGYAVTETEDSIVLDRVIMTATSLQMPDDFTEEEAIKLARFYRRVKSALLWWIGGLANTVQRKFGEKYTDIMKLTGFSYGRCRNIASVEASFHLSLRSDKLTFGHHIEIAKMESDDLKRQWIDYAVAERLSVRRLRLAIKGDGGDVDKQRRQTVSAMKSAFNNAVGQYLAGDGFSSRALSDMRMVLDAMERNAPIEEIAKLLNYADQATTLPSRIEVT